MLCVVGSLGLCFVLLIPVDFVMYCRFCQYCVICCRFLWTVLCVEGLSGLSYVL